MRAESGTPRPGPSGNSPRRASSRRGSRRTAARCSSSSTRCDCARPEKGASRSPTKTAKVSTTIKKKQTPRAEKPRSAVASRGGGGRRSRTSSASTRSRRRGSSSSSPAPTSRVSASPRRERSRRRRRTGGRPRRTTRAPRSSRASSPRAARTASSPRRRRRDALDQGEALTNLAVIATTLPLRPQNRRRRSAHGRRAELGPPSLRASAAARRVRGAGVRGGLGGTSRGGGPTRTEDRGPRRARWSAGVGDAPPRGIG